MTLPRNVFKSARLIRRSILAVLICYFFLPQAKSQESNPKTPPKEKTEEVLVYHIKIHEEIELGLFAFVKRALAEAKEKKVAMVLFEINTFGGRVDAAVGIRDAILDSPVPTVAFINRRAISAGALISLSCDKILINEAGTIGAATPIQVGGGEAKQVEAKVVSYFASEMRATAERTGRPPEIAAAMVDPDIEIKGITKKGSPLTLTTKSALKVKLADDIARTIEEAITKAKVLESNQVPKIVPLEINWAELISRFLTRSSVSPLLITLGVLLLFFELKTPGFGVAGIGAILAFGLFFFGHMIANLAGLEELILFVIGVGLIAAEIFLIPGFGLAGILGIFAITIALVLSGIPQHIPLEFGKLDMPWIHSAVARVGISVILSTIGIVLLFAFGPKTRLAHGLFLENTVGSDDIERKTGSLLGKRGAAYTHLRPAGKALIDGKKINVVTEGTFIEKGKTVEVILVEGNRVVVRKPSESIA